MEIERPRSLLKRGTIISGLGYLILHVSDSTECAAGNVRLLSTSPRIIQLIVESRFYRSICIQHRQKEFRWVLSIVINRIRTYFVWSIEMKKEAVGHGRIVV